MGSYIVEKNVHNIYIYTYLPYIIYINYTNIQSDWNVYFSNAKAPHKFHIL